MHQVEGEYPDFKKLNRKSLFYLNADQAFNPFTWSPPIQWEGIVGEQEVNFTQTGRSGSSAIDFDWKGFPEDLKTVIPYIVDAIDKAMKTMD